MSQSIQKGLKLLRANEIPSLPNGFKVIEKDLPCVVQNKTGAEQFVAFADPPRLVPILRRWMKTTQCDFNRAIKLS